jgi:hypothetical protein
LFSYIIYFKIKNIAKIYATEVQKDKGEYDVALQKNSG